MAARKGITHSMWEEQESLYVTGDISLSEIAKTLGVSYTLVRKRAKDDNWQRKRDAFRAKVKEKALERASEKDANRLLKVIEATNRAVDIAVKALNEDFQFHVQLVERVEEFSVPANPDGTIFDPENNPGNLAPLAMRKTTEEREFRKVDTRQLKDLVGVIKECTRLLRDFYNAPTPAEAEARRVAAERLEIEKKRADAINGTEDDDDTGVVILPEIMEPDSDG